MCVCVRACVCVCVCVRASGVALEHGSFVNWNHNRVKKLPPTVSDKQINTWICKSKHQIKISKGT